LVLAGKDLHLIETTLNSGSGIEGGTSPRGETANGVSHFKQSNTEKFAHLYTHAQADSTDQEPMIYFANSVLKLSELNTLERFKIQLLVLSACKTAVGKTQKVKEF